jgi:hypothetical protein
MNHYAIIIFEGEIEQAAGYGFSPIVLLLVIL